MSRLNIKHLEAEWFEKQDPNDPAELDHVDAENPVNVQIVWCSTRWNVSGFVKLDSPILSSLIKHLSGNKEAGIIGGSVASSGYNDDVAPAGQPDDWDIDEYV